MTREEPPPDGLPDRRTDEEMEEGIRHRLKVRWYTPDDAADVAWLVAEVERHRTLLARIRRGHTEECAINYPVDGPCTCGFEEATDD